jgi:hypothetical protein
VPGVEVETDSGGCGRHETPGHGRRTSACSSRARLLISATTCSARVVTLRLRLPPDPAGEFLRSLDVVDASDARLCLPGHGRTFADVRVSSTPPRASCQSLARRGPGAGAADRRSTRSRLYGRGHALNANWWLRETLVPAHLEVTAGQRRRRRGGRALAARRPPDYPVGCASTSCSTDREPSSRSSSSRQDEEGERTSSPLARAAPLDPFVS